MTSASRPHVGGDARRRPLGDVVGELGETKRVVGDPFVVGEAVANEDVHHRQHQRDVGAGERLDELVGAVGGDRAERVDHDDPGAVGRAASIVGQRWRFVSRVLVAQRMISLLWLSSSGSSVLPGAVRHRDAGADRRAAQRAHEPGGADVVEEPAVEAHQRQQALVAGAR